MDSFLNHLGCECHHKCFSLVCNNGCGRLMNRYSKTYFIISLFVGSLIYFLQKFTSIQLHWFLDNYLNDFLFIPILLFTCLVVLIWIKKDHRYQLSLPIILYVCAVVGISFEYVIPKYLVRYTADPIDVFLYFLSGFIFYLLQKTNSFQPNNSV